MECPVPQDLIQGQCYTECPLQTVIGTNPTVCMSTLACPFGTQPDAFSYFDDPDTVVCIKVPVAPVEGICPSIDGHPYGMWTPGVCYVNCPEGFLDNGDVCQKLSLHRIASNPTCRRAPWYTYSSDSSDCVWSAYTWGLVVAAFVTVLSFMLMGVMTRTIVRAMR